MALTAKFIADFSSFFDAVQKAEVEVKGFGGSVDKVGEKLNRMVDSFNGRAVIEQAT